MDQAAEMFWLGVHRGPLHFLEEQRACNPGEEMLAEIRSLFGDLVFDAVIPLSVVARDAVAQGSSVLSFRSNSRLAMAYRDVSRAIIMKYGQAA